MVNAFRYCLTNTKLQSLLHEAPEHLRTDEGASMQDFFEHLDINKQLWRTIAGPQGTAGIRDILQLNTNTHCSIVNTGLGDLLVGDEIYMLPAICSLANSAPSVNMFDYLGQTYVHPMCMGWQDRQVLLEDLSAMRDEECDQSHEPVSLIGGIIKKYVCSQAVGVELPAFLCYLRAQCPVGVVIHNLEGSRRSVYDVSQNVVSLGSEFICMYRQF